MLQRGNLRGVCDGSFDDGYGTEAWYIDGNGSTIGGVNVVPVGNDTLDLICCGLAGIYTILHIIECMVEYDHMNNASIEIGCNCEGGIKRTLLCKTIPPLNYVYSSHLEIINPINNSIRSNKIRVTGQYVRVHQDDYCVYKELDWWEQRNIDMDLLAKSLMYERRRKKLKKNEIVWLWANDLR